MADKLSILNVDVPLAVSCKDWLESRHGTVSVGVSFHLIHILTEYNILIVVRLEHDLCKFNIEESLR